jgi:hypothetical protein
MPQSLEYQKVLSEIVFINLPGPAEPTPGMTGGELLHGFLAELHASKTPEAKIILETLCRKWNVVYKQPSPGI